MVCCDMTYCESDSKTDNILTWDVSVPSRRRIMPGRMPWAFILSIPVSIGFDSQSIEDVSNCVLFGCVCCVCVCVCGTGAVHPHGPEVSVSGGAPRNPKTKAYYQ